MSGIGVIHNPFARKNLTNPFLRNDLAGILGGHGTLYETKNVQEIEDAAKDFLDKGYDVLAVNGGDGSLHVTVTAFKRVYGEKVFPQLVILRGGTMNTISNSLKLKGSPVKILSAVVEKYKNGEEFDLIPQQLLKVNDNFGFMSGGGAISKFLDTYYAGESTGVIMALKMIMLMIGSTIFRTDYVKNIFSPVPMKVSVDGENIGPDQYLAVLGSTVREVGVGFALTHKANEKPGFFHFIATSMSPPSLVLRIWKLWAGKEILHPEMHHNGIAAEVVIEPAGKMRWMLDGEMYDTYDSLNISVGPMIDILRI